MTTGCRSTFQAQNPNCLRSTWRKPITGSRIRAISGLRIPQPARELIHRSGNHEIIHTPLQTDSGGQLFIERENWLTIHNKRYDTSPKDLIHDLQDNNMTQVQ